MKIQETQQQLNERIEHLELTQKKLIDHVLNDQAMADEFDRVSELIRPHIIVAYDKIIECQHMVKDLKRLVDSRDCRIDELEKYFEHLAAQAII